MPDESLPIPLDALLQHTQFMRALARGLLGDEHLAEDAVQEAWLSALERPPADPRRARGWLAVVASNAARTLRRSRLRQARRELVSAKPDLAPSTSESGSEALEAVTQAVLALSEPYRTVVLLRYYEGLSLDVIADRLGAPKATIRSRLHRALALLRERLRREEERSGRSFALALLRLAESNPSPLPIPWAGAIFMASKVKLAAVLVLVFLGALAWWGIDGAVDRTELASTPVPDTRLVTVESPPTPESVPTENARAPLVSSEDASGQALVGSLVARLMWEEKRTPAVGLPVRLVPAPPTPVQAMLHARRVFTDALGIARFENLPVGDVSLTEIHGAQARAVVEAGTEQQIELLIPAGVQVEVLVTDATKSPVANAEMWISTERWFGTADPVGRTGGDGRFSLRAVPHGHYVGVRSSEHGPLELADWRQVQGKAGDRVEWTLVLRGIGARLEGLVLDPAGSPREGARVSLADGGLEGTSVELDTDAHGRFTASGLSAGRVLRVRVHALGCARLDEEVEIPPHATHSATFRLQPEPRAHGILRDEVGACVQRARLAVLQDGGEIRELVTFTHDDGTFELGGLPIGSFELAASKGYATARASFISAPGDDIQWDAVLSTGLVLTSRLVSSQGEPIARATVEVNLSKPVDKRRSFSSIVGTDEKGRFRVANCPEEALRIAVRESEGSFVGFSLDGVHARSAPEQIVVPDANRALCGVRGKIVGESGNPAHAEVRLHHLSTRYLRSTPSAADTGEFELLCQPPGEYLFEVVDSEGRLHDARQIKLGIREVLDLGTIELHGVGQLAIDWGNANGLDLGSAAWRIARSSEDPGWSRCARGAEIMEPVVLAAGSYVLEIYAPTVIHEVVPFEITAGSQARLRPQLRRGTTVTFRFSQPEGTAPVSEAHFEVLDAEGTSLVDRQIERHPKGLLFTSVELPAGSYRMRTTAGALRSEIGFVVSLERPRDLIDVLLQ